MSRSYIIGVALWLGALAACSEDAPGGGAANSGGQGADCPEGAVEVDGRCEFPVEIAITPSQIGPARVGVPFSVQFGATGGAGSYAFEVVEGLPAWLSLSPAGLLSGQPSLEGESSFRIKATDASGDAGELALTLRVVKADCAAAEVCGDGLDNNCDGSVDEDCPVCEPSDEVCDGVDNDCDEQIDEGVLNACGACGEAPQEVCGNTDDEDCDGVIDEGCECVPSDEVCDGLDNDCDATVDEGCACEDGQTRVCGAEQGACELGTQRCAGGEWSECEGARLPSDEACDGEDNDCDGLTDEGLDELGACENRNGAGVCAGTLRCVEGAQVCSASEPQEEVCDGVDNDCDGGIDEDRRGDALRQACGADDCDAEGTQRCRRGVWEECSFPEESCGDGLDNNCDGAVDEECPSCVPSDEVCDGVDNDCDEQIDEDDPSVGQACVRARCGYGVQACEGGALTCEASGEPPGAGASTTIPVEGGFIRSYTGSAAPYQSNGQTSYSVLLASDGERVYNVGAGIDGDPFAGWTVKVFVPGPEALALQETFTIPVDWEESDASEGGFVGIAADGERLWVTNVAGFDRDNSVWVIDLTTREAEVAFPWGDKGTSEGSVTWDARNDQFWTLQFNATNPLASRYLDGPSLEGDSEEGFALATTEGDPRLGAITTDGKHLYAMLYDNQPGTTNSRLWRFGAGFAGTVGGGEAQVFARVRSAASLAYHSDGYLYLPDQNNLARVQRVAATASAPAEVCDGLDNDCDGAVDDGACAPGVDLQAGGVRGFQPEQGEASLDILYSALNLSGEDAGPRVDEVRLVNPNDGQTVAVLGRLERGPLASFSNESYEESLGVPAEVASGTWQLVVVVDVDQEVGDDSRGNNTARATVEYREPGSCTPDGMESNNSRDDADGLSRAAIYGNLTQCGDEDWFSFELDNRQRQRVIINYNTNQGLLDLYAYDSQGNELGRSTDSDGFQGVEFQNNSGQTRTYYVLVVRESGGQVDYSLTASPL